MKGSAFSASDVRKISKLANIPVTDDEAEKLAEGFTATMKVVDKLTRLDVKSAVPTSQVTGLENVFRDDVIDVTRILPREAALSNGKRTHNGYFVVDQILDE